MRVVAVRAGWSRDSLAELSTRGAHDLDERRELLAATGAEPLVSACLLEAFRDRAALGPNLGVLRHERQEVVAVDLDLARVAGRVEKRPHLFVAKSRHVLTRKPRVHLFRRSPPPRGAPSRSSARHDSACRAHFASYRAASRSPRVASLRARPRAPRAASPLASPR